MPRIREVTMDGMTLKIAPLSYDEAEEYIQAGREMIGRDPKPSEDEWARRTLTSVVNALNKAAGKEEWSLNGDESKRKLTKELDMVFINKLYAEFVQMSGLVPTPGVVPGGKTATSTSPTSDVAS